MANKKETAVETAVFTKTELIENAKLLGTTPEIMAGALVSVKEDFITKNKAVDAVKAYTNRVIGKE